MKHLTHGDLVALLEEAEACEEHILAAWHGQVPMTSGLDRLALKLARALRRTSWVLLQQCPTDQTGPDASSEGPLTVLATSGPDTEPTGPRTSPGPAGSTPNCRNDAALTTGDRVDPCSDEARADDTASGRAFAERHQAEGGLTTRTSDSWQGPVRHSKGIGGRVAHIRVRVPDAHARPGMARQGSARHGEAWHGRVDGLRRGSTPRRPRSRARRGEAGLGRARPGVARQGKGITGDRQGPRFDPSAPAQGRASPGGSRPGWAGPGQAWRGKGNGGWLAGTGVQALGTHGNAIRSTWDKR